MFEYDWSQQDFRCLLCDHVATYEHCMKNKHMSWAGWLASVPEDTLKKQQLKFEMEERCARLRQMPLWQLPPGLPLGPARGLLGRLVLD